MHYQRAKHRAHPERMRRNNKRYHEKHRLSFMLKEAKRRAKKLGVDFNLTVSDIVFPTHCPVLGIPLSTIINMANRDTAPSLDRTIPEFGYVKGNVQVISFRANRIKNDATFEEIEKLHAWMLKQKSLIQ